MSKEMGSGPSAPENHRVVPHADWLRARTELLAREKEFTRQRDELNRQRRELPWESVEKSYAFEGPRGKETLSDLFDGRSQLLVYHFMFSPEWDEGCPHCSFWADSFDGTDVHLAQRDVTFLVVSRAPLAKLEAFRRRMGWRFKWVSSTGSDFNFDYQASFSPDQLAHGSVYYNFREEEMDMADREGLSAFYRDPKGAVFHTYSTYARGIDLLNCAYNLLDLAPKGRDEDGLEFTQAWVRHHDRYPSR
ncbi:MAG TPA: thioredoxin family protein [Anaeromyxobacter sp.]|nr:thioredoxin family protein [Anaeromyxobacter sp.]